MLCVLNKSETVQDFPSSHRKNKLYIRDTNKCFFVYTNAILYCSYMFRRHANLRELYTKI